MRIVPLTSGRGQEVPPSFTYNHAGTISAVAGVATFIPVVDVVAAPVAIVTGGMATEKDVAHGNYLGAVIDGAGVVTGTFSIGAKVTAEGWDRTASALWNRGTQQGWAIQNASTWAGRAKATSAGSFVLGSIVSPADQYVREPPKPHKKHK